MEGLSAFMEEGAQGHRFCFLLRFKMWYEEFMAEVEDAGKEMDAVEEEEVRSHRTTSSYVEAILHYMQALWIFHSNPLISRFLLLYPNLFGDNYLGRRYDVIVRSVSVKEFQTRYGHIRDDLRDSKGRIHFT